MRAYHYHHLVTFDETNLVGNVYFAHFLHWQGHCRERFLADYAPSVLAALDGGELALVTVSCAMDYYAECFAFDRVDVLMRLATVGGNRIGMDFEFVRAGTMIAQGRQMVACMRRSTGGIEPIELPAELAAALAEFS